MLSFQHHYFQHMFPVLVPECLGKTFVTITIFIVSVSIDLHQCQVSFMIMRGIATIVHITCYPLKLCNIVGSMAYFSH